MGRFQVLAGVVAVAADRLVAIVSVDFEGTIMVRDLASGTLRAAKAAELSALPAPPASVPQDFGSMVGATDAQWEQARTREVVIRGLIGAPDLVSQVARAASRFGVTRRTIFRWLAAYREAPQTSSLLQRPGGTPPGAKRIDARLERVISEVTRDVYLTKVRAKKEEVVRQVGLRCSAEGLDAPSRKAILTRLRSLDARAVAKARLQPAEAAALFDPVPGAYRIDCALDVVQIDHTRVDVIVVDEAHRLPIGRPWLTLAIDVATRVVAGFYVSLEAPSSTSVALCIAQAVLPKEPWLHSRDLTCPWPVWGLPKAVHADNGPDFTAAALRRGCDEHGIKLILRPIATPHYGGHIERLIGTVMGRVHLLPGTTGSNPQDKGAYPAEAESVLTVAELERWLALEICEQYHRRVHRGLRRSPLASWQEALRNAAGGLGALPDQPEQFALSFLPFERRNLRRDGLHLFHIRYWDAVLPSIAALGEPMLVRYDPRNLSKVYVAGPDSRFHPIPYADLKLPPITLWEQRAAIAKLRKDGQDAPGQAKMFEAVRIQRELVDSASAKTKAARRQVQRRKDAAVATTAVPPTRRESVDYSKPAKVSDSEIWDN
ncbi:MAG: Mu transposase C-terminal domain-containing protein [Burkholderiales bacterium]